MSNVAQKSSTPPPAPQSASPPAPAYIRWLDALRRALLIQLAEVEDQMIEAGALRQRSIPRRER